MLYILDQRLRAQKVSKAKSGKGLHSHEPSLCTACNKAMCGLIGVKMCSSCTFSDEGYCWSDVGVSLCEGDLSSSEGAHQEVTANGV